MKYTLLLLVAVAATASASNLRASVNTGMTMSQPLLARCRVSGVTADKCCNYGAKDHALYQKPKEGKSCCNKNIGMWVPAMMSANDGKFCHGVKAATGVTKRTLQVIASASYQFRSAMSAMERTIAGQEYRFKVAYRKHEKHENAAAKKNEDAIKQLNDKKEQEEQVEASYKAARDALVSAQGQLAQTQAEYTKKLQMAKDANVDALKRYSEVQAETEGLDLLLKKEAGRLEKCTGDKKQLHAELAELKKALETEVKSLEGLKADAKKANEEIAAAKAANEAEAKKINAEIATAKVNLDKFNKDKVAMDAELKKLGLKLEEAKETLIEQEGELEDAKDDKDKAAKKLDRKKKDLKKIENAFLEEGTQDKFIGRAIKAIKQWWTRDPYCDENCKKVKAFKYYWYVNAVIRGAEPKIKVKDTVDIMKNELGEMVNTFAALKAIKKRNDALHKHDVDLHKKIMAALEKKFAKVQAAMSAAIKSIAKLEKMRETVRGEQDAIIKRQNTFIETTEKQIEVETNKLEKTQADTEAKRNAMDAINVKIGGMRKLVQNCKNEEEGLKLLKTKRAAEMDRIKADNAKMQDQVAAAEKAKEDIVMAGEVEQAKLKGEAGKLNEEAADVQAAVKAVSEDVSDGKQALNELYNKQDEMAEKIEAVEDETKDLKKETRKVDRKIRNA